MSYALITGGNKGIGKAIAGELAKRQINLILVARSEQSLREESQKLAQTYGIKTDYLALDLSSPDAAATVHDWCRMKNYVVNILVNNAGFGLSGSFEKYGPEDHFNMMRVNIITPVLLCQLFLPMLRQQPKSYIMNMASSAAYQAVPYLTLYSASKAFLLSFSRGLRQELLKTSVSVTCVCPGSTDTGFASRAMIGKRGLKTAEKLNMTPAAVAKIAVSSMFAGKPEVIAGFVNKMGAFMSWLLPKSLVEGTVKKMYQ